MVVIIPSTVQSGTDRIGFVLGKRSSTISRRPRAAALLIGISPCYIAKVKSESEDGM
jgi:hypothetical protein